MSTTQHAHQDNGPELAKKHEQIDKVPSCMV